MEQRQLEEAIAELQKELNDLKIEVTEVKGDVNGLLKWQPVFEQDMKDALKSIKSQLDIEMREQTAYLRSIEKQIQENARAQTEALQKATNKLPLWASMLISAILVIAGWGIEIAIGVGHHGA